MTAYLFPAPAPVWAPIAASSEKFPVRRVFCVGRNYAEHAREMGRDPEREPPFFFTKWCETVVRSGTVIAYPPGTQNFHYEGELVAAIGRGGRNIAPSDALQHVFGYATGLDMTRRDLQLDARAQGRPWDVGKNVEQSSPLGLIHPASQCGHLASGAIRLSVNGAIKQQADLSDLIWPVPDVIAFLSKYYRLEPGDLIFTGTPAGVGPVVQGDELVVHIDGLTDLQVRIGPAAA
jgi:fumarylpyruvate hydrolase